MRVRPYIREASHRLERIDNKLIELRMRKDYVGQEFNKLVVDTFEMLVLCLKDLIEAVANIRTAYEKRMTSLYHKLRNLTTIIDNPKVDKILEEVTKHDETVKEITNRLNTMMKSLNKLSKEIETIREKIQYAQNIIKELDEVKSKENTIEKLRQILSSESIIEKIYEFHKEYDVIIEKLGKLRELIYSNCLYCPYLAEKLDIATDGLPVVARENNSDVVTVKKDTTSYIVVNKFKDKDGYITYQDIVKCIMDEKGVDKKKAMILANNAILSLVKRGVLIRVSRGVYRFADDKKIVFRERV